MSNKVTLKENKIGITVNTKTGYIDSNTRKLKTVCDETEKVVMPELVCEITEYMDKFRIPQAIYKGDDGNDWMRVYICGIWTENKNGEKIIEPEKGEYYDDPKKNEKHYFLWMRIPGYTCGNIIINRADDTIYEIKLVHKGGGFSRKNGSAFKDTVKLEKELNEMFKGKKITFKPLEG